MIRVIACKKKILFAILFIGIASFEGMLRHFVHEKFLMYSELKTFTVNGKHPAGEGVIGMGRAFQYAGAKSVLVSLWGVAEKSATYLVERFFAHVKAGQDKIASLRRARREVKQKGYKHPEANMREIQATNPCFGS